MNTEIIELPIHWASYLINGDDSGLTKAEIEALNAYLDKMGVTDVLEALPGEGRFTWSYELFGGQAAGGTVAEYVVSFDPKA